MQQVYWIVCVKNVQVCVKNVCKWIYQSLDYKKWYKGFYVKNKLPVISFKGYSRQNKINIGKNID